MVVLRIKYFPGSCFSPSFSCGEPFIFLPVLPGVFITKHCSCEHPPFHIPLSRLLSIASLVGNVSNCHPRQNKFGFPLQRKLSTTLFLLWKVSWGKKSIFKLFIQGLIYYCMVKPCYGSNLVWIKYPTRMGGLCGPRGLARVGAGMCISLSSSAPLSCCSLSSAIPASHSSGHGYPAWSCPAFASLTYKSFLR